MPKFRCRWPASAVQLRSVVRQIDDRVGNVPDAGSTTSTSPLLSPARVTFSSSECERGTTSRNGGEKRDNDHVSVRHGETMWVDAGRVAHDSRCRRRLASTSDHTCEGQRVANGALQRRTIEPDAGGTWAEDAVDHRPGTCAGQQSCDKSCHADSLSARSFPRTSEPREPSTSAPRTWALSSTSILYLTITYLYGYAHHIHITTVLMTTLRPSQYTTPCERAGFHDAYSVLFPVFDPFTSASRRDAKACGLFSCVHRW
nr:hypothetical protein CFP56_16734 [Quercus suber]